jgi:hypothetical protein
VAASGELSCLLLGPLTVRAGGDIVTVGAAQHRAVLAALLLSPGRYVGRDALIDLVWNGTPPDSAVKTLQSYVSRLRSVLTTLAPRSSRAPTARRTGWTWPPRRSTRRSSPTSSGRVGRSWTPATPPARSRSTTGRWRCGGNTRWWTAVHAELDRLLVFYEVEYEYQAFRVAADHIRDDGGALRTE